MKEKKIASEERNQEKLANGDWVMAEFYVAYYARLAGARYLPALPEAAHEAAACLRDCGAGGAIVMVVGYTLGRAFVYSTPEYAIMKLPFQCLQAGVGAVTSWILCCPLGLTRRFRSIVK